MHQVLGDDFLKPACKLFGCQVRVVLDILEILLMGGNLMQYSIFGSLYLVAAQKSSSSFVFFAKAR
jgi:hypothetical protein